MAGAGKRRSIVDGTSNDDPFVELDSRFRSFLEHLTQLMRDYAQSNRHPDAKYDDEHSKRYFSRLMKHAVEHAMTPQIAAAKLGVTVSTVHRWAKGEFVPSQRFIRVAAIADIESEISQLLGMSVVDSEEIPTAIVDVNEFQPRLKRTH